MGNKAALPAVHIPNGFVGSFTVPEEYGALYNPINVTEASWAGGSGADIIPQFSTKLGVQFGPEGFYFYGTYGSPNSAGTGAGYLSDNQAQGVNYGHPNLVYGQLQSPDDWGQPLTSTFYPMTPPSAPVVSNGQLKAEISGYLSTIQGLLARIK